MDNSDNPDNPRPNTNWLPSIADQCTQASIPISVFWASTSTRWASGHPTLPMMGPNPTISFHQTLTLFLFIVIISHCLTPSNPELTILVHPPNSLLSHPHCP